MILKKRRPFVFFEITFWKVRLCQVWSPNTNEVRYLFYIFAPGVLFGRSTPFIFLDDYTSQRATVVCFLRFSYKINILSVYIISNQNQSILNIKLQFKSFM